jgi:hypothetical protein
MVKTGSTLLGVENTTGILLEYHGVSLNSDRGWSLSDGSFKLVDAVWPDFLVSSNSNLS